MMRWMDSTRSVSLSGSKTLTRPPLTATGTTVSRVAFPMLSTTFMHHPLLEPDGLLQGLEAQLGRFLAAAGAAGGWPPVPACRRARAAAQHGQLGVDVGLRRSGPRRGVDRPAAAGQRGCCGAAGRRADSDSSTDGDSPRPRRTWAVSRGAAWEISTVGAMRTSPRPAAAGALSSSSRAVSSSLWMKLAAAPTRSRAWRAAVSSMRYSRGCGMAVAECWRRKSSMAAASWPASRARRTEATENR